ncbi:MAG: HAMP domain-containing sensor histidine kinase [Pseudomonadota bacterium]
MGIWFKKSEASTAAHTAPPSAQVSAEHTFNAHDIRNIVSSLSLLADQLTLSHDPHARQVGDRIGRASDRLIEMTGRAITAFGPGAEVFTLKRVLDDVEAIVSQAATPGVALSFFADDDIQLGPDTAQVFRIICNLSLNAVTAMNKRGVGELHVFSHVDAEFIDVFVMDTGPGLFSGRTGAARAVTVQASPKQALKSGSVKSGSGLGLLIALQLATEIDAELDILTSDAGGSSFRLRLSVPSAGHKLSHAA